MTKSDAWMKVAAICIFGLILLVMCVAAVTGVMDVGASYTAVVSVAIFGMIVVIVSDRVISLTMSKGQLKVQLAELKRDVRETIKMVRSDMVRRPGPTSASGPLSVREEEYAKHPEEAQLEIQHQSHGQPETHFHDERCDEVYEIVSDRQHEIGALAKRGTVVLQSHELHISTNSAPVEKAQEKRSGRWQQNNYGEEH